MFLAPENLSAPPERISAGYMLGISNFCSVSVRPLANDSSQYLTEITPYAKFSRASAII